MAWVSFAPSEVFRDRAVMLMAQEASRIQKLIPSARVEHIGGTSIPGALTKGDVDVLVTVAAADFPVAVDALRKLYAVNQPENWTPAFASFKDDTSFPLAFGAQLVTDGAEPYAFLALRERLCCDPVALADYNAIKRAHEGRDDAAYREAKGGFIERLLNEPSSGDPTP